MSFGPFFLGSYKYFSLLYIFAVLIILYLKIFLFLVHTSWCSVCILDVNRHIHLYVKEIVSFDFVYNVFSALDSCFFLLLLFLLCKHIPYQVSSCFMPETFRFNFFFLTKIYIFSYHEFNASIYFSKCYIRFIGLLWWFLFKFLNIFENKKNEFYFEDLMSKKRCKSII